MYTNVISKSFQSSVPKNILLYQSTLKGEESEKVQKMTLRYALS